MIAPIGDEAGPQIIVEPVVSCSAGVPATLEVQVWHRGPRPAGITVAVRGLDADWTPEPVAVGTLAPGEGVTVRLELRPGPSALGARYPFVVVAVATDALGRGEPVMSSAESTLVLGGREPTVLDLDPPQTTAVFGRRVRLTVTNPSLTDRELTIEPTVPAGLSAEFAAEPVAVPAGRTVTVRGKVRVRRPRVFGTVQTHSYAVAARGQGAPVVVTGTVKARPVFRGALVRALVLLAVVALWAGLAVVAIPQVSSYFTTQQEDAGAPAGQPGADGQTGDGSAGAEGDGGGTGEGADTGGGETGGTGGDTGGTDQPAAPDGAPAPGGDTGGGEPSGETGGGDTGETLGEQPASGAPVDEVSLRGLVTGPDPGGVTVVLGPTSISEAAEQDAEPAPGTDEQTASGLRAARDAIGVIGKVPASAVRVTTFQDPPTVTTTTNDDGTFAIGGVRPQGFYLLTLARAGYQTQRFIVNGENLTGADPMKIGMIAGGGAMSGTVTGPDGPVGAATVTITDGQVSVQTSSVSPGAEGTPGSWSVTGLSTPGTYLVSAAAQGFGTASTLVTLGAGGTATADLTLQTGVAAVTGLVTGQDQLGQIGGLGGISVLISGQSGDVSTTRTATTLTTGPVGRFTLPDLPTPGDYTLTVSGDGYQDQVRTVSLAEGVGSVDVNVSLTRADGAVSGTVFGNPATADQPAEGGLVGAGLTLTGPAGSTKTMTTSDPPGSFRFTGVVPGVYVLSGTMFGRVTSSVTVEVTAAGEATAELTLISSADTELPATAHIQGRVTDSRTGGDITCDRAIDPDQECVITASVSVPAIDPETGRIDPDAPPETVTAQANPGENYLLPAMDDPDHRGLVPGLYTVTITAPGYEPGSVSVQVPQGATMSAAPVSLVPLSLIAGRLTTRVGTPQGATCIAVVSTGTAPPQRSDGCVPAADAVNCTVGGDPTIRCGLVQEDGTYQVRGLVHGGYTVVVLPTDPEYIEPAPFSLSIELGSDGRYDPVLDRLGRIAVTVRQPDPDTGELSFAEGATVVARQGTANAATGTTGADGTALLTSLQPGAFEVAATGAAGTATEGDVLVQLNQTVDINMVIVRPLGVVIGRVMTSDGRTEGGVPVPDATTAITGIVGYAGTTATLGTATMITDDNGCFAIVPAPVTGPVTGLPNLCPTITEPAAIATTVPGPFLVARPVSVQVGPTPATQGTFTAQVSVVGDGEVRTIPVEATTVLPNPSPTTNLGIDTLPAGTQRNVATLTLLSKPPGSGLVSVSEDPGNLGSLQWNDTAVTGSNLLSPGRYSLQAQLPGFTAAPVEAHVLCPLGQPCNYVTGPTSTTIDDNGLRLIRNPTFSGQVTVLPTGANISAATFTVTPLNVTVAPINLTLSGATTLLWQEAGLDDNRVTPGTYSISASAPGFESGPITFTCPTPTTGLETCTLPELIMRQLATPTIFIRSNAPAGQAISPLGATVLLTGNSIGTIGPLNAQSVAGGVQVTLPPLSSLDTSYRLTVKAPGFAAALPDSTVPNSCRGPSGLRFQPGPSTCTVDLTQLGRINVTTVQSTPGGTVPLSSVTVTATPLGPGTAWSKVTDTNGTAQLIGTLDQDGLTFGSYELRGVLPGYLDAVTFVTIGPNALTHNVILTLQVKPVTFNVTLLDRGTAVLPVGTVRVELGAVSRFCTISTSGGPCTSTDGPDTSVVGSAIAFRQLVPGVYTVSFEPTGAVYQSVSQQFNVVPNVDPQSLRMSLARRSSNQTGTVVGPNGAPLAGAQVSLRQNNNVQEIARDLSGAVLPTLTTGADGAFSYSDVPDGLYRVMVDACGYDRAFSATITLNSQVAPTPPAVTVQVARTLRQATITLTSTAGANLAGAQARFEPATSGPGTPVCAGPVNTDPRTGFTVAADGTVNAQLPTGYWNLVVTQPPATAPFGSVTTGTFLVDQPDRGVPAPPPDTVPPAPPVTETREVRQAAMTMTATWPAGCAAPPTAVTITVTRDPGTPSAESHILNAAITSATDGSGTATVTALLPPGDYAWTVDADTFTADPDSGTFTVPATGETPAVAIPVSLLPPEVPVTSSATVDGAARNLTVTATRTGDEPVISDPDGVLCVPPGSGWTFSVRSEDDETMLIQDITNVTVTREGPNTVTFIGFTLQPGVALEDVENRTPDATARSVSLTLTGPGTTWSGTATILAGGTTGTGPLLTLGAGSYTLSAAASAPFGAATEDGIDPSTTHTVTLTLPYQAVTLAVTATIDDVRSDASVSITPAQGGSPNDTTEEDPAIFRDIPPGTYTITATETVEGTVYEGELAAQEFTAGTSAELNVPMTAPPPTPEN